jgi:hypothetical protein
MAQYMAEHLFEFSEGAHQATATDGWTDGTMDITRLPGCVGFTDPDFSAFPELDCFRLQSWIIGFPVVVL